MFPNSVIIWAKKDLVTTVEDSKSQLKKKGRTNATYFVCLTFKIKTSYSIALTSLSAAKGFMGNLKAVVS